MAKRFDPRELMELAVDVMVQLMQEPRGDDKASPLVGAVLWNDGTIDTASRSELRDGDHAELTLLELRATRHGAARIRDRATNLATVARFPTQALSAVRIGQRIGQSLPNTGLAGGGGCY